MDEHGLHIKPTLLHKNAQTKFIQTLFTGQDLNISCYFDCLFFIAEVIQLLLQEDPKNK